MAKKKKNTKDEIKEVTADNLKDMTNFYLKTGDKQQTKLLDKVFTTAIIDQIPKALEQIREESPTKFLYHTSLFLSLLNKRIEFEKRSKQYDQQLKLEEDRVKMQQTAYGLNEKTPDMITSFEDELKKQFGDNSTE